MREIIPDRYSLVQIDLINSMAQNNPGQLIDHSEQLYFEQLKAVSEKIVENIDEYKIIMLSGPSASGKTTTAHKLAKLVAASGFGAKVISLDDFYLERSKCPLRPDGTIDLETVFSLDLDEFHNCVSRLVSTGEARFPLFDFTKARRRKHRKKMILRDNEVLIFEGIHALNPLLTGFMDKKSILKLFVSVRSKFAKGEEIVLNPKDVRLIRRMVRDKNFRNSHPVVTLNTWEGVCEGEREHINPFRDTADIKIDSTIDYEPCMYRYFLYPLLSDIDPNTKNIGKMLDIYEALGKFETVDSYHLPDGTVLREFLV